MNIRCYLPTHRYIWSNPMENRSVTLLKGKLVRICPELQVAFAGKEEMAGVPGLWWTCHLLVMLGQFPLLPLRYAVMMDASGRISSVDGDANRILVVHGCNSDAHRFRLDCFEHTKIEIARVEAR